MFPLQARLWPRGWVEVKLYSSMTAALEGVSGQQHASAVLYPGRSRYPLYRRLCRPQGRSGRAENLAPTGIRSPDRPARSQSLYRPSYPDTYIYIYIYMYIERESESELKQSHYSPGQGQRVPGC